MTLLAIDHNQSRADRAPVTSRHVRNTIATFPCWLMVNTTGCTGKQLLCLVRRASVPLVRADPTCRSTVSRILQPHAAIREGQENRQLEG